MNTSNRIFDQLAQCFPPEIARKIINLRADDTLQTRMDELADRNTAESHILTSNFITTLHAHIRSIRTAH